MALPSFKLVEKVVGDKDELSKELSRVIEKAATEAIKERGVFTLGLSGGSMAKFVCAELPKLSTADWQHWKLLFCDERLVPLDSPDNTLQLYLTGLTNATALTRERNFIEVDTTAQPDVAAKDYEAKLRVLYPAAQWPTFDLLLLGVGPDGHTASLFPGHGLLNEGSAWVSAITDSPKPPPCRVTLTLPAINSARKCVMAFAGQEKAEMVKELMTQFKLPASEASYPAARIRPSAGELLLLMDSAAASQ